MACNTSRRSRLSASLFLLLMTLFAVMSLSASMVFATNGIGSPVDADTDAVYGTDSDEADDDTPPSGIWSQLQDTFQQIREALSLTSLLDAFTTWTLEQMQWVADRFLTAIGTVILTAPPHGRDWVKPAWDTALLWTLLPLAVAILFLGWKLIHAKSWADVQGRVTVFVLALFLAASSFFVMDLSVAVQNRFWLDGFQEAGVLADVDGTGCDILPPDAGAVEWGSSISLCGDAAMRAWFGSEDAVISSGNILFGSVVTAEMVLLGALLMVRDLVISLLVVAAPPYLAAATMFGGMETLVGFGTLVLRTVGTQSLVAVSALLGHAIQDGVLDGGGDPLVWSLLLVAVTLWTVWKLWAKPTAMAITRPIDLGGSLVLDGFKRSAHAVSGTLNQAGARLGRAADPFARAPGPLGAAGRAAAGIGAAMMAKGHRAAAMGHAAGAMAERIRRDGTVKTVVGAVTDARAGFAPYAGPITVDSPQPLDMSLTWGTLEAKDAASAKAMAEQLRQAGFDVDGVDGSTVLLPRQRVQDAVAALRPTYERRFVDMDGQRRLEFHARQDSGAQAQLLKAFEQSKEPVTDVRVDGDWVSVPYEQGRNALAVVRAVQKQLPSVGTATMNRGELWASVHAPMDAVSDVASFLQQEGVPTRVVGDRIYIPPSSVKRVGYLLGEQFISKKVPYWTMGHRFVVELDGVPVTVPHPPRDGLRMGPWRGGSLR